MELCRRYNAFIVTDVPRMSFREKDLARRFIIFIDAVYESKVFSLIYSKTEEKSKIVLTSEVPIHKIFSGEDPIKMEQNTNDEMDVDSGMRSLMDDLGISMEILLRSSIFVSIPLLTYLITDW